jgi:hypothetical protein
VFFFFGGGDVASIQVGSHPLGSLKGALFQNIILIVTSHADILAVAVAGDTLCGAGLAQTVSRGKHFDRAQCCRPR